VVAAAAAFPVAALADKPTPPVNAAISQYVEMVPTVDGPAASGSGKAKAVIPPSTKREIDQRGGADADLLTKVVSSEAYGAPQQFQAAPPPSTTTTSKPVSPKPHPKPSRPAPRPTTPRAVEPAVLPPAPLPPAPSAASAAFGSLGGAGLLFALALVGGLGLAVIPAARRRQA
jgi:hypothetical protein